MKKILILNNTFSTKKYMVLFFLLLFIIFVRNIIVFANVNVIEVDKKPIAVMIGNSPAEQNIQKGLSRADVIYEIEVEFPFTRLMAIFSTKTDTEVGPVRSSRFYFSRICAEWSAMFAHCGGQSLKNSNIIDLNELSYPAPYWRDEKIGGWINLFTNLSNLTKQSKSLDNYLNNNQAQHPLLNIKESEPGDYNQVKKISIKYHKDYIVSYDYCLDDNKYYRYINNKPHFDNETNEQIKVSNIIIQTTKIENIIGDNEGRIQVELIGEGTGRFFKEGISQPVKWTKKNKDEQTSFLDSKNNIINYGPGIIWVHILDHDKEIWCK